MLENYLLSCFLFLTAIRSGDYYMFEDIEDDFELDVMNKGDSDDEEEKKSATRRRLSKKMNFSQVSWASN